jgi:hypothetical protein
MKRDNAMNSEVHISQYPVYKSHFTVDFNAKKRKENEWNDLQSNVIVVIIRPVVAEVILGR